MSTLAGYSKRTDRRDFETIAGWIGDGARVLDLGCGDGSLLRHLQQVRQASGYGIEIDDNKVLASMKNGVNVLQADLEAGLSGFDNDSFDYVILSLTLQAVRHTERIVKEMLRVGRPSADIEVLGTQLQVVGCFLSPFDAQGRRHRWWERGGHGRLPDRGRRPRR